MSQTSILFNDATASWSIDDSLFVDRIDFVSGSASFNSGYIKANYVEISDQATSSLDLRSVVMELGSGINVAITNAILSDQNSRIIIKSGKKISMQSIEDINFKGTIWIEDGELEINSENSIHKILLTDSLTTLMALNVDSLMLDEGSVLTMGPANTFTVNRYVDFQSSAENQTSIRSGDTNSAIFFIQERAKYCFSNVIIDNVDLSGESVVTVGLNSTLNNSANWQRPQ